MRKVQTFKLPKSDVALSILAGILYGTSYIPFPAWAIFFCFVPLWIVWLRARSWKRVFFTGWIFQFVLSLVGFNWIAYTVHTFGHIPYWGAAIALLLFCSFNALNVPLAGVIWYFLFKPLNKGYQVIGMVVLTALTERFWPMIFDFHLGYTFYWMKWPAYQSADIFGFFGLSSLIIVLNGLILWAWLIRKRWPLGWAVALFAVLNLIGLQRLDSLTPPDKIAKVLIVQANIGDESPLFEKYGSAARKIIFDAYANTTKRGLSEAKPDFVVWPETAFPDLLRDPNMPGPLQQALKQFLIENQIGLVTGGYGVSRGKMSNSLFAFSPSGEWASQPYAKTHLLAFGEYVPGAEYFPKLKEWIPEAADWGRGFGPQNLTLLNFRLGGQICYEGLFDFFSRGLSQIDSQLIVNATHDNWYGTWQEPYQHGFMTFARAVETRIPLIRGTNTGISGVALANGEILTMSPMDVEWSHYYEVPYLESPEKPPFSSWGYYLIPSLLWGTMATLTFIRIGNGRGSQKS